MAKNIVICSDGTGNSSIKGRGTNVFKLFEAVDLNGHRTDPLLRPQIAMYDDGVGTQNLKPLKVFAGMTGFGLSRNVKQLYKELVRVYDAGDQIYLFGFSRGAYTVRTLGGLIGSCGVLDRSKLRTTQALNRAVSRAYKVYRRCYRVKWTQLLFGPVDKLATKRFRAANSVDDEVRIRFIGVWDTVDAVGLPFHLADVLNNTVYRFKFPDKCLSPIVDRACHALSIDDERHSFQPVLWNESAENCEPGKPGRIEQVWFSGAHSNVGGGYPKQGMSLVALDWMMAQAEQAGLRMLARDRAFCEEHASVDDKLYDPRAGLGAFYRWKVRHLRELCAKHGVVPKLHMSVLERVAHGTEDYAPGNLPPDAIVVATPGSNASSPLLEMRAKAMERVLHESHSGRGPLLDVVRGPLQVGRLSYYVYLASCVAVLAAASGSTSVASLMHPGELFGNIGHLVGGLVTSPVATVMTTGKELLSDWRLAATLAVGFVAAYLLALYADTRMAATFSPFWHAVQQELRDALKDVRKTAKEVALSVDEVTAPSEAPAVLVKAAGASSSASAKP